MHRIEEGHQTHPNITRANSAPSKMEINCRDITKSQNKLFNIQMKNIWKGCVNHPTNNHFNTQLMQFSKKSVVSDSKAKSIAINTLSLKHIGSNNSELSNKLTEIKKMPADTLDQKAAKEKKFRELVKTQYDLRMVTADGNNGLRAIIVALHKELDPQVEDTLSMMLRGDMIHHILNNPQRYTHFLKGNDMEDQGLLNAVLMTYCEKMKKPEEKIGTIEMAALSDILRTPIFLHNYIDPQMDENNHLMPCQEKMLGARYQRDPIHLYFDPLQGLYMCMKKKL